MKIRTLTALALLVTSLNLSAQFNSSALNSGDRQVSLIKNSNKAAEGSMYLNEQFLPSKISGQQITYMLRYDAYHDYFEMTGSDGAAKRLPANPGEQITTANKTYTLVDYKTSKNENIKGYLSLIYTGSKAKIYRRERVIFQAASESNNSYVQGKPAAYKRAEDEFYISVDGQPAQFLQPSRKGISKLFPDKAKQIQEFMKTNNVDLDNDEGLKKLGAFLDTI